MRPPRATSTQPCCPSASESSAQSTPRTLANRANLASWIGRAGDAVGARDQFAALLPIRERVSGSEYPDTLDARNNLAYWTKRAEGAPGAGMG